MSTGWSIVFDDEGQRPSSLHASSTAYRAALRGQGSFARIRQHCIAMNGMFFNTHRIAQYVSNAYFPQSSSIASTATRHCHHLREPVLI